MGVGGFERGGGGVEGLGVDWELKLMGRIFFFGLKFLKFSLYFI